MNTPVPGVVKRHIALLGAVPPMAAIVPRTALRSWDRRDASSDPSAGHPFMLHAEVAIARLPERGVRPAAQPRWSVSCLLSAGVVSLWQKGAYAD